MTMASSQQDTVAPAEDKRRLQGWALTAVLASLMLANFLSGLDQVIVDTAMPHIIGDLQGFDRYTWVITAYLLCFTMMVPIAGKLSDQFGRKWLLMGAITLFLVSSALAGASQTMNQLIAFRGMQGLSAGAIQTLVSTIVADIFSPAERPRWQGLNIGVFTLASVIGPTTGGWITDHLGWRWVFYINVPLVPLALIALFLWMPAALSTRSTGYRGWAALRRIDALGAVSMAGATACLLLGLTWGGQMFPWSSPQVVGILIASGALFVVFFINERFAAEPILPLRLTRNQVFVAGALLSLTTNMALLAMVVYIPLFVQGVLGQSATSSGVVATPLTLAVMLTAVPIGFLVGKVGRYQWAVVLGCVILLVGALLMTTINPSISPVIVVRNMVVIGVGIGMALPVLSIAVQNAVPRSQLGAGTGAMSYLRSLGSTLGVAVIGTVLNNTVASELPKHLPPAASQLPAALLNAATNQQVLVNATYRQQVGSHLPPGLLDQLVEATRQTLALGIEQAFWVAVGICALTVLVAFFLKDVPLRKRDQEAAAFE
ncbi:MAG TPA: MDR family MFS transporter [Ktedonobacterales bacterium]|nr:MDR family MFS transporter [Ktedonobacterales bacterium]